VEEEERNKTETAEAGKTKKPKNPGEGKKDIETCVCEGLLLSSLRLDSPSHADRLMNDRVPPKREAALGCCTCSGLYQTTISVFFFLVTYILPPLLSPFASPPPIFISIIKNQLVYRPFFVFKFLPLFYLFQPTPNANNNINGIQKKKGNEEKNKIK
jgi:hypothetical protein